MTDKKSIVLSEEQLKFIKKASSGKNILVDAPEGYGKTTTLYELCERLPGRRKILYFAVDRTAKNEVEDALGKGKVEATYFQGFAFKELRKIGVYGEPEELLSLFAKVKPSVSGYDVVIVDEFQFIDANSAEMLKSLKSKGKSPQFVLAGNTENKFYDKSLFNAKIFADELLGEHEEMRFKNCYEPSIYTGKKKDEDKEKSKEARNIDYDDDEDLTEFGPDEIIRETPQRLGDGLRIAVVDAELNSNEEVMSVGAVVADPETYKICDERYYILTPENNLGGKFLKELRTGDCVFAPTFSRAEALEKIDYWLKSNNVNSIYAYNAAFDREMLPELSNYMWYDIMKLAAYKQNNPLIAGEPCNKDGRLKRDFGVGAMIRRMTGDVSFTETHNALYDARDELRVMELLNRPISDYECAAVDADLILDLSGEEFEIESVNDVVLEDDAITAAEAETILNVSRNTVYKLIKKGSIFGYKRDNRYIVSKRSVEDYLERLEQKEAAKYKKTLTGILSVILLGLIYLWHLAAKFF